LIIFVFFVASFLWFVVAPSVFVFPRRIQQLPRGQRRCTLSRALLISPFLFYRLCCLGAAYFTMISCQSSPRAENKLFHVQPKTFLTLLPLELVSSADSTQGQRENLLQLWTPGIILVHPTSAQLGHPTSPRLRRRLSLFALHPRLQLGPAAAEPP